LVYSTKTGRIKESRETVECSDQASRIIKIRREVKGRGGKTVTTLNGFSLPDSALQKIAAELKRFCGSGGSVKDSQIVIQGDQRDRIESYLREKGYVVKRASG
jgi:translation initiation factor 1